MTSTADIDKLQARISYLEENRRFIQNALETVLSLGEFQTTSDTPSDDIVYVLEQAGIKISSIIPFEELAFYLVDDKTFLFNLTYCSAADRHQRIIEEEVGHMIDQGMFAWAVREKRGVLIPTHYQNGEFLLHVISSNNRIRGMFIGTLPERKQSITDTSLTLLSIVLIRVSGALEEIEYRRFLANQTVILEQQVQERTKALTDSESQLKEAMHKANLMAEKAKMASAAKSEFLAKMSHELRTPLNGIIGMTEMSLSTNLNAQQIQFLNIIDRESNSLLKIINDILDFSKIEAGKLTLEKADFDLRQLMDEVADTLASKAFAKGLELTTYLDPKKETLVKGDPFRLKQILLNLGSNAVKFTSAGLISLETQYTRVTETRIEMKFLVSDTGIGIPKDKHAVIFEDFSQADDSTTRQYGGTGLGITISKQLVELMGGALEVTSEEGQGSTFWFSINLEKQANSAPSTIEKRPKCRHAFVVCAPGRQRDILTEYVTYLGLQVRLTEDPQQAWNQITNTSHEEQENFVAIIDLLDAKGDGALFCRRAKQRYPEDQSTVLALGSVKDLTGLTEEDLSIFDGFLSKPIKLKELITALQTAQVPLADTDLSENHLIVELNNNSIETSSVGQKRILLVDDYPTNQKVASMHLINAGYKVDIACNGQEALEAYNDNTYGLILMDIQMPVMDGFTAAKKIRRLEDELGPWLSERIPILAMTAHAFAEDEQKCRDAGMNEVITKPIRREILLSTVAQWLQPTNDELDSRTAAQDEVRVTETPPPQDLPMDFETGVDEFGSPEVLMEVVEQLLDNIENQTQTMADALDSDDFNRIRKESHAIKGGAGTIEAHHLASLASKIETGSKEKNKMSVSHLLDEFNDEFERLKTYVSTLSRANA
jgi:signal transduction histidine kinase/CheY-like chemotaxis protein